MEELFREIAILQAVQLAPDQFLRRRVGLEQEPRHDDDSQDARLVHLLVDDRGRQDLVLDDELVQVARAVAVVQQSHGDLQRRLVRMVRRHAPEAQRHHLDEGHGDLQVEQLAPLELGERRMETRHLATTRDARESLLDNREGRLNLKITAENQTHVRGDIIRLEETAHGLEARILQVLGTADDGVCVGMILEITLLQTLDGETADVIAIHVLLLIDCLQLALEEAEDGIEEAFAVDFRPLAHVLGREDVVVRSEVGRGPGVQLRPPVAGDEAVELVGNDELGSLDAESVDFCLDVRAELGVVGLAQFVVLVGDLVEEDLFGGIIGRPDFVGTLEHHVLEVMGDTGVRAVLCPRLDDYRAEDLRLVVVLVQPNSQAITQRICLADYLLF